MTLLSRRLLLYSLIVVFILGGTFIAAISSGYVLNIFDGSVERTGGVFIKSQTPRIAIYLDGSFQKETSRLTSGALLTNVTPGTHLLRIEKNGYHPWSKGVTVEPTLVTELRNILLVATSTSAVSATEEEQTVLTATTTPSLSNLIHTKTGELYHTLLSEPQASTTLLLKSVNSFTQIGNTLFAVQENGFLTTITAEGGNIRTIGRPGFFLSSTTPIRFIPSPQGAVALIDASGGLLLLTDERNLLPITSGVKSVSFDSTGTKLLIQKTNDLEILWLEENQYQPFQKEYTTEHIISVGEGIHEAQWLHKTGAHIVFRTNEGGFVTELDGRGGRNTIELFTKKAESIRTIPEVPNAVFLKTGSGYQKIIL